MSRKSEWFTAIISVKNVLAPNVGEVSILEKNKWLIFIIIIILLFLDTFRYNNN